MNKKSISREAAEEKEGLEQVRNEVSESKMQADQQIQNSNAALEVKGAPSSFQPKKTGAKGQTLKQQVVSDAITGSNGSAGMGINAAGRSVSGTIGGVLGANNSTPFADKSRHDSRIGKKLDRIATKLNYTPSETSLLAVDESKPLADAAALDQGFNGTYRNEFGRSQKIMGAVPADLMFQRSVDLIMKDKLYFVEGQQVFQSDDDRTGYDPQRTVVPGLSGREPIYADTSIHAGNYLHRGMHVGLDSAGQVQYVYFDVDDLTHAGVTPDEANGASAHRLIKSNVAELDRMAMDTKAGDEKAEIWTPLARAIDQPTKWSYLLSSIEADTGAYAYLAYSKASTNMSFQLNRGPKDGLSVEIPAMEQFLGWRAAFDNSTAFKSDDASLKRRNLQDLFSKENYRLGDPSLMIDAYDSVTKYNNKADLLLQPRGWRMHLQTADNNINALRVPSEFANVYAGTEVFSTIDREYDPLLPICMTDKANLVTVHNFNELAAFYKNGGYQKIAGKVSYTAITNNYQNDEIVLGKAASLKAMGWDKVYVYCKFGKSLSGATDFEDILWDSTNKNVYIKADSNNRTNAPYICIISPTALNTTDTNSPYYQYTLMNAGGDTVSSLTKDISFLVPKVADNVTASTLEVDENLQTWYYCGCHPLAYAYSDLRNNYIVEVKHPLVQGIVEYLNESIGAKIRAKLDQSEFYIPFIFSTQYMTLAQLIICAATPWIQRVRYNSMKDVIYYQDNVGSYPFSKLSAIKEVPFKNYVNFSYQDYDSPLATKVMNPVQAINWIMPEFFWKVATEKYVLPWYFCENDLDASGNVLDDESNMCMPSIRSGIRLGGLDTFYGMTEKDIRLSLDRMTKTLLKDTDISSFNAYKYGRMTDGQILANLGSGTLFTVGKILQAPRELGLTMDAPLGVLTVDPSDVAASGQELTTALKTLAVDGTATSYRIKIWTNTNTLQHPTILSADGVNVNRAANYSQKWYEITANGATTNLDLTGLVFGLGDDAATYSPFAVLGTGASAGNSVNVVSYQRSMFTRLQMLPFVISPFDSVSQSAVHDIYDFAYFFGLCGFRASDYRESVYNREKEVFNQGMLFVEDPWILDSPIIRGASASTGIKETKGYEIK